MIFLMLKSWNFSDFWFLFPGRTEEAASNQSSAGRGGGGDPQDGINLVDDQVPDHLDREVSKKVRDSLQSSRSSSRPLSTLSPASVSSAGTGLAKAWE